MTTPNHDPARVAEVMRDVPVRGCCPCVAQTTGQRPIGRRAQDYRVRSDAVA